MIRSLRELCHEPVTGREGLVGRVRDFLFDDDTWRIHYFVIALSEEFANMRLLISAHDVRGIDARHHSIMADLTNDQMKSCPDITADPPVGLQPDTKLHYNLNWPYCSYPSRQMIGIKGLPLRGEINDLPDPEACKYNPHLRSFQELKGYLVHDKEGEAGRMHDMLVQDDRWEIQYLAVNLNPKYPTRKVLVPTRYVKQIQWDNVEILLKLDHSAIEACSTYDAGNLSSQQYQDALRKASEMR